MTDEEKIARLQMGRRGMSKEEMAERQRNVIEGMRPMTPEEIIERQGAGLQNYWPKMPGEV